MSELIIRWNLVAIFTPKNQHNYCLLLWVPDRTNIIRLYNMYYLPTQIYYPPTYLYYTPTRMYYLPTHMYYLRKSVLSTNSHVLSTKICIIYQLKCIIYQLHVLSTNYMYYPPTLVYYPPTQILLSTNSGHSNFTMPGLPGSLDVQIDPWVGGSVF